MAVDYFAQVACPVRAEVSDTKLLEMLKARNRARVVLEAVRNNPNTDKSKPESEWIIMLRVRGPSGIVDKPVKIYDMLMESKPLDALAIHCKNCPANVRNNDFGCGGAIQYPIPPDAEEWLISRLPADIKSERGLLLLKIIADLNVTGAPIDAARNRDDLYVMKKPITRTWGNFISKKSINSSQILQLLLNVGSMQSSHAKMIAFFLGFLSDQLKIDERLENRPQKGDSHAVMQFKSFIATTALAGTHNVPLLIDA